VPRVRTVKEDHRAGVWCARGMTGLLRRLHAVLDEFNAAYPWDHNAYYHRWILRQLPPRFGRALDAGSGSGDLARLLAGRADRVCGIDIDPVITARARELTDPAAPVVFTVGDVLTDTPAGPYDVVTCVAAVHHMPLAEALTCFRDLLAPGGTLVVVGLYRAHGPIDVLLDGVSVVLNPLIGWVRHRGRRAPRPVSMTAVTTPATMTFAEIVAEARRVLPRARLRRRLLWRYTLVWRKP